ncbi:TPR end-of-group domain-containing protein [Tautonia sociabilis]|uniref:TPR end-of-group domain-containing protein n=1 Tax=Tautonia sociabilis TaxID=2080755 RepID=UPI00131549B0|nr:tetratricopeptide repeat protein [Tautonia sociabilis]
MRNAVVTLLVLVVLGTLFLLFPRRKADPSPTLDQGGDTRPERLDERAERHFLRGEYAKAAEAYRLLLDENPEDPLAWIRLAYATHELGDFEASVDLHRRAAEFEQNRIGSHYRIGCALARLGRPSEAIDALEDAVEAGYYDRTRAENDPDLASLRGNERFELLLDRMAPPPPGRGPLDFWVGNWASWDAEGDDLIGHVSVRREENSRLFVESWNDYRGTSGRGMAYRDPSDGRWHLLRVDSRGEVHRLAGEFRDQALELSGERISQAGRVFPMRAVLRPQGRGWVILTLESTEDGGETWVTLADRLLRPEEPTFFMGPGRR